MTAEVENSPATPTPPSEKASEQHQQKEKDNSKGNSSNNNKDKNDAKTNNNNNSNNKARSPNKKNHDNSKNSNNNNNNHKNNHKNNSNNKNNRKGNNHNNNNNNSKQQRNQTTPSKTVVETSFTIPPPSSSSTAATAGVAIPPKLDEKLCDVTADPRGNDPKHRMTKKTAGRNTESFDPKSTLVRPALRVLVGSASSSKYPRPLKHDDVVIVPELFGPEHDTTLYYKLVEEMTELQKSNIKGSEWISWHEGAHLIVKNPKGSKTFQEIIDKLCDYFSISKQSVGTRFNWYKDSTDWKPFHHDSAAFNPLRAKTQNITVGVSFGATRELAFLRANENDNNNNNDNNKNNNNECRLYFPQPNNGVFTFGRDVNIHWKHGINALPEDYANEEDKNMGRVSIILWGLAQNVIEEEGSPPMLGSDGQGPHAASQNNHYHHHKNRKNHNGTTNKKKTTTHQHYWRRNNPNNNSTNNTNANNNKNNNNNDKNKNNNNGKKGGKEGHENGKQHNGKDEKKTETAKQ